MSMEQGDVFQLLPRMGLLFIPQMTNTVEWYWQEQPEEIREKPVPVSLCSPQILHGLTRERIQTSAARGRRLTAWAMTQPFPQRTIYSI
jgi:hypothetical protein